MSATVLLGITGGIAAYKTPSLVRLLVQAQMNVNIVMTRSATHFVTPLALATVSGRPVWEDMWGERSRPSVEHISLADSADIAVIAPATANTIGKMACGIADNMLTTVIMAVQCPVLICPSMNVNMLHSPVVQENLRRLADRGFRIMAPESGFLACGWTGEGRMPDPEAIFEQITLMMAPRDCEGLKVLVTAGPTEEPLDPVRFLTNRSSGKMGVAIARRAAARGADVTLIAGPLAVVPPAGVRHVSVRTAQEMHDRVMEAFPEADVVIKAAAVSDFRQITPSVVKTKKEDVSLALELVRNPDILAALGKIKRVDQLLVGFAAETHDVLEHGRDKLRKKNLDMLVLNDVSQAGAGFDYDTNIVRFLHRSGEEEHFEIMPKGDVADLILDRVLRMKQRPIAERPQPR